MFRFKCRLTLLLLLFAQMSGGMMMMVVGDELHSHKCRFVYERQICSFPCVLVRSLASFAKCQHVVTPSLIELPPTWVISVEFVPINCLGLLKFTFTIIKAFQVVEFHKIKKENSNFFSLKINLIFPTKSCVQNRKHSILEFAVFLLFGKFWKEICEAWERS